ncbi:MAG: surface lipoprotein assembly modifier, partial [Burkholderiales bacterium]
GEPQFDYFFGVAAIDAGHAGDGVLALERYLIRFPRNPAARVQLARGYFALGDDVRARQEFERSLASNPPPDARLVIGRYLDAIRLRESRYRNTSRLYVEAGVGADTNVNAGVAAAGISLPILGNVTVLPNGVRRRADFAQFATGGDISHPVAPGVALFGAFALDSRNNASERDFDLFSTGVAGGASLTSGRDRYSLALSQNTLWVGGARFRSLTGFNGEWTRGLDELSRVQMSAQLANEDYPGANAVRNAHYAMLGADYRRLYVAPWQPVLVVGASYGGEHNTENRPDLGRALYGVRAGIELTPSLRWGLSAGLSYLESRYDGPDLILATVRKDHYAQLDAAATYLLSRSWSLRGELMLADNRSDLELYGYTRELAALKLRYEFK